MSQIVCMPARRTRRRITACLIFVLSYSTIYGQAWTPKSLPGSYGISMLGWAVALEEDPPEPGKAFHVFYDHNPFVHPQDEVGPIWDWTITMNPEMISTAWVESVSGWNSWGQEVEIENFLVEGALMGSVELRHSELIPAASRLRFYVEGFAVDGEAFATWVEGYFPVPEHAGR